MKPIIIAIIGESGSGKTTLALHLQDVLHIPAVVSYTTRAIREGEIDGRDHYFVSPSEMPTQSQMLAYTLFGGNHYWTTHEQVENQRMVTYVIDEKGLVDLEQRWGDKYEVIPVYVSRPDNPTEQSRKDRDQERIQYSDYQCVLVNDGTLQQFFQSAIAALEPILSTKLK